MSRKGPRRAEDFDLRINARGELEPITDGAELARDIIGRMLYEPYRLPVPLWCRGLALWIGRNTPARIAPEELQRVGLGPVARLLLIMQGLPHLPRA